jgi:hypothetical protein
MLTDIEERAFDSIPISCKDVMGKIMEYWKEEGIYPIACILVEEMASFAGRGHGVTTSPDEESA